MNEKTKNYLKILGALVILLIVSFTWLSAIVNADVTSWEDPENYPLDYDEMSGAENVFSQDDSYMTGTGDSREDEESVYEFQFTDITLLSGNPVITGIQIQWDAYASNSGKTFDIKLTWDLGTTWSSAQTSGAVPTSDTDTYYYIGGSSETWGHSWTKNELTPDNFGMYIKCNDEYTTYYFDHIQARVFYNYEIPDRPNAMTVGSSQVGDGLIMTYNSWINCDGIRLSWVGNLSADTTYVRYDLNSFPNGLTSGTFLYNGSNSYYEHDLDINCEDDVFYSAWSYNATYNTYSTSYSIGYFKSVKCNCCDNTSLTLYENIINATGTHNSSYSSSTGWKVWANYTGNDTSKASNLSFFSFISAGLSDNPEDALMIIWIVLAYLVVMSREKVEILPLTIGFIVIGLIMASDYEVYRTIFITTATFCVSLVPFIRLFKGK